LSFIDLSETELRISVKSKPFQNVMPRGRPLCRPLLEVLHLDPTSLLDGTDDDGTGLTRASNALESSLGLVTVGKEQIVVSVSLNRKAMRSTRLTQRQ
jgi:hypothetical protein